jgi:hypothetical protein
MLSLLLVLGGLLSACIPRNVPLGPNQPLVGERPDKIEIEVARDGVFKLQNEQPEALPLAQRLPIEPGQIVKVDEKGRALLHLGNVLTLELLQGSQVQVERFSVNQEKAEIELRTEGGALIVDLRPSATPENLLTLYTPLTTITAANMARFTVISEDNNALEWVVGLAAREGDLLVTAENVAKPVIGGQARWVTVAGEPSPVIPADRSVEVWLNGARNNSPQLDLSEVLLAPTNILADTGAITRLPAPGTPFEIARADQGVVNLTLDPEGIFGSPIYILEDCNGDDIQDIVVRNGVLTMDFRNVLGRIQALDISLLNRSEPGQGLLQTFDPAGREIDRQQLQVGPGVVQTLSMRSNRRYYGARLIVGDACFLGFSLTPPGQDGEPGSARPVTENLQSAPVVNVLETSSAERPPLNSRLQAPFIGELGFIKIDGEPGEWDILARQNNLTQTDFSTITYDDGCARRAPGSELLTDLAGRVQLAYDGQFLYAAFVVNDDGLVTYSGPDQRYFLGDSPQLLLDLRLSDDFEDAQLSSDDIQVDLLPNIDAPQVALWQLSNLSSGPLTGAQVAIRPTDTGYFVEAALPWQGLGFVPRPGDRLGIVASVSDNDTPGTNAQECIISTSPQRDWRNPTTWGTVLLRPAGQ